MFTQPCFIVQGFRVVGSSKFYSRPKILRVGNACRKYTCVNENFTSNQNYLSKILRQNKLSRIQEIQLRFGKCSQIAFVKVVSKQLALITVAVKSFSLIRYYFIHTRELEGQYQTRGLLFDEKRITPMSEAETENRVIIYIYTSIPPRVHLLLNVQP